MTSTFTFVTLSLLVLVTLELGWDDQIGIKLKVLSLMGVNIIMQSLKLMKALTSPEQVTQTGIGNTQWYECGRCHKTHTETCAHINWLTLHTQYQKNKKIK